MPSIRSSSAFRRAALLSLPTFLALFFACSDDGVGPPAQRAAGIAKLNGDVQVGVVGRALPDSLVVKVTDKAGKAVAGVPVLWEITAGGGQAAGAAVTSSAGEAKASWTLGTVAGANALVVRAGAAPSIAFQATAEAGAPAVLELVLDSLVLTTPGEAIQVSAAVRDSFENVVAAPALTYALSDTMVARVNAAGMVTAKATGEAVLTVSAASVQQTIPVRVRLAVTAVELNANAATMNAIGDTVLLSAVARNAAGGEEAATITWTSSNGNIATVTDAGAVVGHSVGTALIIAAAGSVTDTAVIEVRQVLASVSASAAAATITAGDSVVIAITAADSNGVAVGAASVEWASGDSAVASVSPVGVVRGARVGSAEITATVTAPASPTLSATVDVSVVPAAPAGVVMVWGDGQGATIGSRLSDSLVVNVTDSFGNAVPNQMVRWTVVTGGGSVSADTTATDASGAASVIWTLGMTPGENTLTASAGTGSVTFMANAAQAVTPAGGSIAAPEQVATVTVPAGAVSATTAITIAPAAEFPPDADLIEGTVYDFGPDGTQFSEPVTIALKFDADALPAGTIAEELFIVHGENNAWTLVENSVADLDAGVITGTIMHFSPAGVVRRASILELLTDSAELSVGHTIDIDAQLRALPPNQNVTTIINPERWESSDESIATVDANGVVTGVAAGVVTITATHGAGRTATAKIVVTEPTAASLEIISGNGGTFPAGDEAPDSLVVRALDEDGEPVAGVIVTWHATAGGGSVSPASSTTDANGDAAAQLTLGAATADNVVQARVEGVDTAFFTVRGETATLDSVAAHSDTTLSAIVDTNVTDDPAVIVLDQFGRPMAGIDVEFVITAGGGSLTGANDETNADGIATVGAWKLGSTTGVNTLEARIDGADPVVFTAMAEVGAVARLVLTGAATQVAGEPQVMTITAMDEFGNTVEAYEGPKNLTFSGAGAAPRGDEPTVTDRNGAAIDFGDVATVLFTNGVATTSMVLYAVENVTLSATDEDISAAGADQLAVAVEHAELNDFALVLAPNQINTEAFTGTNTLTARDLYQNVVTSFDAASDGVTLTTTLAGTVSGLDTGNDDELEETPSFTNGVADLTGDLTYTGTIGTGTFTATSETGKSGTSGNVTVVPGAATQLFIVAEPSVVANSGAPFAQQPVVRLRDASSNNVLTAGVAVVASLNGGGTLDGTASIVTDANGIATYTDLGISGIIGDRTLSFTSGSLPVVTSTTIDLQPGAATQLSVETQPSDSVRNRIALARQPVVQLRDAAGNAAPEADVPVTAAIATGGEALSGTLTVNTNADGLATFTDLMVVGVTGDRTLVFSADDVTAVTSGTVTVTPGIPFQVHLSTKPSDSVRNDVEFPQQPVAQLLDQDGNAVAQAGLTITARIYAGNGVLSGDTTIVSDANGAAAFTDLKITGLVGDRNLSFSTGDLGAAVRTISVIAGAATQLVILTEPSADARNGLAFAQQPVIQLRDVSGNDAPENNVDVSASILTGGGLLQGDTIIQTNASGTATFTDISITGTIGDRTLLFESGSLATATSGTITLTSGPAAQLVITTEPSATAQSAELLAQQPEIQLRDASGNDADTAGVVITATLIGGGTLNGDNTIATDANGVATFTDLGIEGIIGDRTLEFSAGALVPDTSSTIDLQAGTATRLVITGPDSTAADGSLGIQVTARDDAGNVAATEYNTGKQLTFSGAALAPNGASPTANHGSGDVDFGDPTSVAFGNGITSVTLSLHKVETAVIAVTDGSISSSGADRLTVVVEHGELADFALSLATPQVNGTAFTGTNTLTARDAYQNPVTTFDASAENVTLTTPLTGVVSGLGSSANAVLNQAADFENGIADLAGALTYTGTAGIDTFTATSASGKRGTSGDVVIEPGAATQVVLTTQPSTTAQSGAALAQQPVAQLRDQSDNDVPSAGVIVTAAIASGGGTLGGDSTIATDASGTAAFTDLEISGIIGDRTLSFSAPDLAADTSVTIDLQAGAAAQMTVETSVPDTVTNDAAFSTQPTVQLRDDGGNIVREAGVMVTAYIDGDDATTAGDQSVATDANGVANYTNLKLVGLVGEHVIQFSAPVVTNAVDTTFMIAGAATKLGLTTLPSDTMQNNVVLDRQPVVQVQDVSGNPVAEAGITITATHATPGGLLSGDRIIDTDADGIATYTDLILKGPVGTYVLSFAGGSLTGTSANVEVIAGAPTQLIIQTEPSDTAQAGVDFPRQPVVQLSDVSGNAVAQEGEDVTVSIATGADTLRGTKTVQTDADGVATFAGLDISGAVGERTLEFASSGLTPDTSGTVVVTFGPATHLTITTQPSDSAGGSVAFPQQPVIQLRDASGNAVSQSAVTVTASIASGAGALGGDSTIATNASGVATFTDLEITGALGDHTIEFMAASLTSVESDTVVITAGPPARLAYIGTIPDTVVAGEEFSFQVAIQDEAGNLVPDATDEVIIAGDEAANAVNGVATFSGLQTPQAGTLELEATSGSLIPDTTVLVVTHAAASKLAFTTQPVTTTAGDTIPSIVVEVQDEFGNTVTNSTAQITLNRQTPAEGGGLVGDSVNSAVDGVATFSGLSIQKAINNYALAATATNLTTALSDFFNITHAPLDNFLVEADGGGDIDDQVAGTPFNVTVTARDQFANIATSYESAVTFTTTPTGGISAGGTSAALSAGVVGSHALTFGEGGNFTVTATGAGKTGTSNSFDVTAPPEPVADSVASNSAPNDDFHTTYNVNLVGADGTSEDLLTNDELGFPAGAISSFGAIQTNNGSGTLNAASGTVTTNTAGASVAVGDGSLQVNANGTYTFDPPTNYTGLFRFQYRVTNTAGSANATVTLAVGARPVAVADDYTAAHGNLLGNVPINTATSTDFSVLTNDSGDNKQLFLISGATGGAGLIEVDGTFEFRPTAGYEGAGSMKYQVYNGFGYSDTVDVSMTIDDVVWFIDDDASAGGNGRADQPFNCYVGTSCFDDAAHEAGDKIFLSAGAYTGGDTLLANQYLIGDGATGTFATVLGVSWPADAGSQPTFAGTNPTITASGVDGLRLGSNNTVRGITIGNVGTSNVALAGSSFGTLTHSGITINTNGGALNLNTGTISGNFAGISSSGGTNGVLLTTIAGTTTLGGGAISGASGPAFSLAGGTVNTTYTGNITQGNNAAAVSVTLAHEGTVTFGTGTISATNGTGLQFSNARGTYNFNGTTTLNGGDAGVDITGSTGAFTFGSGTSITSPTGTAFNYSGAASGTINYNGTLTKSNAGALVAVTQRNGGTMTFGGNLNCTGTCTGISVTGNTGGTVTFSGGTKTLNTGSNSGVTLTNNAGATVNFTNGGLAITTSTGTGFNATGGGTVNVSGASNTINATAGTGLSMVGTSGAQFAGTHTWRSISADGGSGGNYADHGIKVQYYTGPFTVSGDGSTSVTSGGTIRDIEDRGAEFSNVSGAIQLNNMSFLTAAMTNGADISVCGLPITQDPTQCNAAIHLVNASAGVTLNRILVNGSVQQGINAHTVTNLVMSNVEVTAAGNETDESGVMLTNISGSGSISNSDFHDNHQRALHLTNKSGTLTAFPITTTTFDGSANGQGLLVDTHNAGTSTTVSCSGCTFTNTFGNGFEGNASSGAVLGFTIANSTISNVNGVVVNAAINSQITATLQNNTFTSGALNGAGAFSVAASNGGAMNATILGNTIGTNGVASSGTSCAGCNGMFINHHSTGAGTYVIRGNTIQNVNSGGIIFRQGNVGGSYNINAFITGNLIRDPGPTAATAIEIRNGITSGPPADAGCVAVTLGGATNYGGASTNTDAMNIIQDDWNSSSADVFVWGRFSSTTKIAGYVSGPFNTYLGTQNSVAGTISTLKESSATMTGGSSCP